MKPVETHLTYDIPVELIHADEDFNCRGKIQLPLLVDLANSIRDQGLHIPVIVWERDGLPNGYKYLLVAGYRRYFACTRLLNHAEILAIVRTDLTEETARRLNFTENLERKDLNICEEAKAIHISFPKDTPIKAIAKALHRSQEWVSVRVHLSQLSEEIQEYASQGLLTASEIQYLYYNHPLVRHKILKSFITARKAGRIPARISSEERQANRKLRQKAIYHRPSNKELKEVLQLLAEHGFNGLVSQLIMFAMGRLSIEKIIAGIERAKRHIESTKRNHRHDHKAEAVLYKQGDDTCDENTCIPDQKNSKDTGLRVL